MAHEPEAIGKLASASLNTTADQAIALIPSATKYIIRRIVVTNVSVDISAGLAAGGVYSAASKGGTAIVAAAQVYTALSAASKALDLTVAAAAIGVSFTAATLYLSLSVAFGTAATADIYVFGDVLF